jgi:hypothetical protein
MVGSYDFDSKTKSKRVKHFDEILNEVLVICRDYGSMMTDTDEIELWSGVLNTLYEMRKKYKHKSTQIEDRQEFVKFFSTRIDMFIHHMTQSLSLTIVIETLLNINGELEFKEIKEAITQMVDDYFYLSNIVKGATKVVKNDYADTLSNAFTVQCEGKIFEPQSMH